VEEFPPAPEQYNDEAPMLPGAMNVQGESSTFVVMGDEEGSRLLERDEDSHQRDVEEHLMRFTEDQLQLIFDFREEMADQKFRQELMEQKVGSLYDMFSTPQRSQQYQAQPH
jgi:hypothetical protein